MSRPLTAFELIFAYERHLPGSHLSGSIVERSEGRPCPFCKLTMTRKLAHRVPSRDHLVPRSRGGDRRDGNRLIICRSCNADKDNMTLLEFVRYLKQRNDPRAGHVAQLILDILASVPTVLARKMIGFDVPLPGERILGDSDV